MNATIKLALGSTLVVLLTSVPALAQQAPGKPSADLQDPNPFAERPLTGQSTAPQQPAANSAFGSNMPGNFGKLGMMGMSSAPTPAEAAAALAKQYAGTDKENEPQRLAVRRQLIQLLTQQFDEHAQQQKKELESLEAEIARLNAQLKKRLAAKEKIIERRFDQLVEEAEGLGWSGPGRAQPSSYYPSNLQRR